MAHLSISLCLSPQNTPVFRYLYSRTFLESKQFGGRFARGEFIRRLHIAAWDPIFLVKWYSTVVIWPSHVNLARLHLPHRRWRDVIRLKWNTPMILARGRMPMEGGRRVMRRKKERKSENKRTDTLWLYILSRRLEVLILCLISLRPPRGEFLLPNLWLLGCFNIRQYSRAHEMRDRNIVISWANNKKKKWCYSSRNVMSEPVEGHLHTRELRNLP